MDALVPPITSNLPVCQKPSGGQTPRHGVNKQSKMGHYRALTTATSGGRTPSPRVAPSRWSAKCNPHDLYVYAVMYQSGIIPSRSAETGREDRAVTASHHRLSRFYSVISGRSTSVHRSLARAMSFNACLLILMVNSQGRTTSAGSVSGAYFTQTEQ